MFCKDDRCERWVVKLPAVEMAGFKMIDVSRASILNTKFRTARKNLNLTVFYVRLWDEKPSKFAYNLIYVFQNDFYVTPKSS